MRSHKQWKWNLYNSTEKYINFYVRAFALRKETTTQKFITFFFRCWKIGKYSGFMQSRANKIKLR